jgi:uncharacterized protein (DUF2267 family)
VNVAPHGREPDRRMIHGSAIGQSPAQDIVEGVAGAIADSISSGQMEELKGQLPAELKSLFPSWPLTLREE